MTERPRAIVHMDLDAFYAAVEVMENGELKGRQLLIGGRPESRGVVSTASYEARARGVHSAMSMAEAVRLCRDAVVLPPRIGHYRQYSRRVMAILREYTPLVEQVSIDEAYLDLTQEIEYWEQAVDIAGRIQARIKTEIKPLQQDGAEPERYEPLTASLGVATNKLVAKVASDREKPEGLTVVREGEEVAFLRPLPVRALWGIGPVTAEKLGSMGIRTVGELAERSEAELERQFGKHGREMARRARGIDNRPVVTEREVKSVSQETTFSRDLAAPQALERQLERLSEGVAERLQRAELAAGTISIKLRYADFTTLTRQMTLDVPTDEKEVIYEAALVLFDRTWERGRPVRLLGVGGSQLSPPHGQLRLF